MQVSVNDNAIDTLHVPNESIDILRTDFPTRNNYETATHTPPPKHDD